MVDITVALPQECISQIISRTSPRDACRLSVVSPVFKSAADSDIAWERFLPLNFQEMISNSPRLLSLSKKDLFFHLCPTIINNGTMSFVLEKETGKRCYMVGARGLRVITPQYWEWPSLPESRFAEVAELRCVWWLEVKGKLETNILCPNTTYGIYLVFKFSALRYGFETRPVRFGVYFEGRDGGERRNAFLISPQNIPRLTRDRGDGWMEIEMGEFFNRYGDDGTLMYTLLDNNCSQSKCGLIIEGIEFRPKSGM